MSLKGNLKIFAFNSLLRMLTYTQRTGKLIIRFEINTIQIFLFEGNIVYATETSKNNRLGELLKESGYISQPVLDECLTLSLKKKQRLGKILVQQGYVTLEKLNTFLLKQAENSAYNVLLQEGGEFEFNDAQFDLSGAIEYKLAVTHILLEASRRIDDIGVLKKRIPGEASVVEIAADIFGPGEKRLRSDEKTILSLINGKTTIREIFDKSGLDDFTAYKCLYSLMSSGKVQRRISMTTAELAAEAVEKLHAIDFRQFMKTLDHLGVTRASRLRVALTRIFREAGSEKQIRGAVKQEAINIKQSEGAADLGTLREERLVPYMEEMIELLWRSVNAQ